MTSRSGGGLVCAGCARKLGDVPVRIEEQYREVTHTYEGHPIETELRPSFAGIYCSLACAETSLAHEQARRARISSLREAAERAC